MFLGYFSKQRYVLHTQYFAWSTDTNEMFLDFSRLRNVRVDYTVSLVTNLLNITYSYKNIKLLISKYVHNLYFARTTSNFYLFIICFLSFFFFLCIKEFIHYIKGELKTIEASSICYKCPYHNRCHSSIKC